MTEFGENEEKVFQELEQHAATFLDRQSRSDRQRQVVTDGELYQSFNRTQEHYKAGFVPLPKTVAVLKQFFMPQNVALNELFEKNLLAEYQ